MMEGHNSVYKTHIYRHYKPGIDVDKQALL